jgi:RNA polymerase sigma-70 factor (ECF subfamily)
MECTDSELMARLAAGEDLALNELMLRWRDRVGAFLYKMTGNGASAADLAQETFVKLYQARERYRPEAKFSTFIFSIAANLGRNQARWRKRHPTISLDQDNEGISYCAQAIDHGQTPDETAASRDRLMGVHRAFMKLPEDLRETMTLFIYENMSYSEISETLGCSLKAAETRIYRARQVLKEELKDIRQ